MGGFLLLPADEVGLVAQLLEEESLTRLAHEDLTYGPPVAGALAAPVPLPERDEPAVPTRLTFWVSQLGELQVSNGSSLDYERSPILVWNRSRWHSTGALVPGVLRAQTRARKDQPRELLRLHERVERWMKSAGVKLSPFDHAPDELEIERPPDAKRFAVFALPHAARWVREGGTVWPPDA